MCAVRLPAFTRSVVVRLATQASSQARELPRFREHVLSRELNGK